MDGGWLQFHGQKFCHFEVMIDIWDDRHWVQWQLFKQVITPPNARVDTVIDGVVIPNFTLGIDHPILADVGINKVYIEDEGAWERKGETGMWTRTIKFIKWLPPRKVNALTKEGPPAFAAAAVVPLTAQQKMNAELDAENATLRARGK